MHFEHNLVSDRRLGAIYGLPTSGRIAGANPRAALERIAWMKLEYTMSLEDGSKLVMYDAKTLSQSKITYGQSQLTPSRTKFQERDTGRKGPYSAGV